MSHKKTPFAQKAKKSNVVLGNFLYAHIRRAAAHSVREKVANFGTTRFKIKSMGGGQVVFSPPEPEPKRVTSSRGWQQPKGRGRASVPESK